MISPIAQWLINNNSFKQLLQSNPQNINNVAIEKLMPEYVQSLGHSRFDAPGNKTIDPNAFSQGVQEAIQMLRTAGYADGVSDIITTCNGRKYS